MCRFIETICFEKGKYPLLELHQERLNRAFYAHFPGVPPHDLAQILPRLTFTEKHKVRVVYDVSEANVQYTKHAPRPVNHIKIVEENAIDYAHKYEDRSELQSLFDQREDADEIIIIKNGLVTDSFYANPVFYDGTNWYAPQTCLLNGVRRQHLINSGKVEVINIKKNDIPDFEKVSLVNALVDLDEISVSVNAIKQ